MGRSGLACGWVLGDGAGNVEASPLKADCAEELGIRTFTAGETDLGGVGSEGRDSV